MDIRVVNLRQRLIKSHSQENHLEKVISLQVHFTKNDEDCS